MNTQKVVVRYTLKADRVKENEHYIKAVYQQVPMKNNRRASPMPPTSSLTA